MIITRSTTIIMFLALSAITLPLACSRHHTPEERTDWIANRIATKLDLTEEQRVKLDAVKAETLRARERVHGRHLWDEAMAQINEARLDETKLLALFDEHQRRQREAAPAILAKMAEFHGSLTPAQKEKAKEALEHVRGHLAPQDAITSP
jgi:Spy/CpxP family protein refolding chaperone